jgi:hypothetical protein
MHHPLRSPLAVEVGVLLEEVEILNQKRPGPAVSEFWLSPTGMPALVVSVGLLFDMARPPILHIRIIIIPN